jgi:hypothetical protein
MEPLIGVDDQLVHLPEALLVIDDAPDDLEAETTGT